MLLRAFMNEVLRTLRLCCITLFPMIVFRSVCLSALLLSSTVAAGFLQVDLGKDTGRHDTATLAWQEWQVPDGEEAGRVFEDLRIALRPVEHADALLAGVWDKAGLATGATLATDGVVAGGGIELRLTGLTPGRHTLATFHNTISDEAADAYLVSVSGQSVSAEVVPSVQASRNSEVASAFLEFDAKDGEPVIVQVVPEEPTDAPVILNGFAIDTVDPARKAVEPSPALQDRHVDGDSGEVTLSWTLADSAVTHHLYFASGPNRDAVIARAASADREARAYIGEVSGRQATVAVDDRNSQVHYAWRVDSVDASGSVTRGDVWNFRVRHLAFPGAEGYGRFAIGGRGGRVIKVTNLRDSGPGSLRAAVEAEGPRTVIFDVSGRIVLKDKLVIRNPYITLAGQTAPGKGICISNYNLGMLGVHDAIVRFMRVRPGNTSGATLDGMGMASSDHSIIDHCSISWTHDEAFSSRGARNITLQRTLISEALNIAGHKKYPEGKQHGFAASISGDIGSFHHNLLAHNAGRNWSLAGGLDKATRHTGRLDIRNNVVYNWGYRTTDGGAMEVNFVNNYYKPGPASTVFHVLMPERKLVEAFGPQDYFVAGNVMEGHYGADEPLAGVKRIEGATYEAMIVDEPFFPSFVETQTAEEAYADVLADVGANVPMLDEHDKRVIRETREGSTTYEGSVSGYPGLPDSQEDVGGWEDYPVVHRPADWDTDGDGMPDHWERARGLDPKNPDDGRADPDGDGYTNLEDYLNELAGSRI